MATPQRKFDTNRSLLSDRGHRLQRVLLVAGDERILAAYARCLSDAGLQVSVARTGFEAIVKASCLLPDAILMHEGLLAGEGVDSQAARELIGVCPATAHIPVIPYSAGAPTHPEAVESADVLSLLPGQPA